MALLTEVVDVAEAFELCQDVAGKQQLLHDALRRLRGGLLVLRKRLQQARGGRPSPAPGPGTGAGAGAASDTGMTELLQLEAQQLLLACQAAAQCQYMLAVALCLAGQGQIADYWAAGLACRFRLSDSVWAACRGSPAPPGAAPATAARGDQQQHKKTPTSSQRQQGGAALEVLEAGDARVQAYGVAPCSVAEAPLPEALLARLTRALGQRSFYWRQHAYGLPETPFFSYLYDLDQAPMSVIELAIQHLYRRITAGASTAAGEEEQGWPAAALRGTVVAEWWAHSRELGAAHQLHFDVNEELLRQGAERYGLMHPRVSCVLFLGDDGGPTLVMDLDPHMATTTATSCMHMPAMAACTEGKSAGTDQEQGEAVPCIGGSAGGSRAGGGGETGLLAARAWAVAPRRGRLLAFRGDLLHGVMPCCVPPGPGLPSQSQTDGPPRRTTLIVAWWGPERLAAGQRQQASAGATGGCRAGSPAAPAARAGESEAAGSLRPGMTAPKPSCLQRACGSSSGGDDDVDGRSAELGGVGKACGGGLTTAALRRGLEAQPQQQLQQQDDPVAKRQRLGEGAESRGEEQAGRGAARAAPATGGADEPVSAPWADEFWQLMEGLAWAVAPPRVPAGAGSGLAAGVAAPPGQLHAPPAAALEAEAVEWHTPLEVSPAWVAVERPPSATASSHEGTSSSGGSSSSSGSSDSDHEDPDEGSSRGGGGSSSSGGGGSAAAAPALCDVALQGALCALQVLRAGGVAGEAADLPGEGGVSATAPAVAAAVAALRPGLPDLRLFLWHERELSSLYLPSGSSSSSGGSSSDEGGIGS